MFTDRAGHMCMQISSSLLPSEELVSSQSLVLATPEAAVDVQRAGLLWRTRSTNLRQSSGEMMSHTVTLKEIFEIIGSENSSCYSSCN